MTDDDLDREQVRRACTRWLAGRRPRSAADDLRAAADALDAADAPDHYGEGAIVESFEQRLASLLGLPAAAVMPTGTMAQQIALRMHCDRAGRDTVAFHPTCHLELHEHGAYSQLHGLHAELVGDRDRLIELDDLQRLTTPLGALLLELPQREIGGRLPEWDDLQAQTRWARERGVAPHLDGARIWEAQPYYERSHAEIAGLFDTVYVSLYKGLGGLGGCVLAGPTSLIDEARVWRRRHGGAMARLYPLVASALPGLDHEAPRMGEYLAHARAICAALVDVPGVTPVPTVPQTPLFHLHLRGTPDELTARALTLAAEHGVWLLNYAAATVVPGVSLTELSLGESALEVSPAQAAELFAQLVA